MHSLAGDADEHAGEFTKALAHYEAAAKAGPSDATLYAVVAELLRHWNWDEAIQIADLRRRANIRPANTSAWPPASPTTQE